MAPLLYHAFDTHTGSLEPLRVAAREAARALSLPWPVVSELLTTRALAGVAEVIGRAGISRNRPPFGIERTRIGLRDCPVVEEAADRTPFGTLLHFKKPGAPAQPAVLLVAPMSGHFATLLRGTVTTMLPEHDVYITDWHNASQVGLHHGGFDFDDYIAHVMRFLGVLGPGAHVIAVCQPCVAVLAAAALMAAENHPCQPASMTLMAGPIDARISPTKVNELARLRSIAWFERRLISRVPMKYPGAMRRVYPGFVQLIAFMSMNVERHVRAQYDLVRHVVKGEQEKAAALRAFYDEYLAVMDLPAEFYLQTVERVFQRHLLPKGELTWRGRRVEPAAIRRAALLTVEGERDDICGLGQTLAAQDLCSGIKPYRKRHHVQPGAGHYGVFSGSRWEREVYPMVRHTILSSA